MRDCDGINERARGGARRGTGFVSVHADDVAFACVGLIRRRVLPEPYYLVTVFTVSQHHADPDLSGMPAKEVAKIRESEDREFARQLGLTYCGLGLRDEPDRLLSNAGAFQTTLEAVRARLRGVIDEVGCEAVVSPWPYGRRQHVHHRLVHQACSSAFVGSADVDLFLVDDQPYSRRPTTRTWLDDRCYEPFVVHLCPDEVRAKLEAIAVYRSQIRAEYVYFVQQPLPEDPTGQPSETIWVPSLPRAVSMLDLSEPARATAGLG